MQPFQEAARPFVGTAGLLCSYWDANVEDDGGIKATKIGRKTDNN